ncbi:hypothetical protein L596_014480 [Steinernema carpocapsae]|uniref:Uncharacterized protein n=1 Tax=Steinernema carpocapsae TaxID=34508 RepID=A0A4U5NCV3_STECR|nr:hypothetical protein L596_014480 [Steinernema carpocapsae]
MMISKIQQVFLFSRTFHFLPIEFRSLVTFFHSRSPAFSRFVCLFQINVFVTTFSQLSIWRKIQLLFV